jgi:hypothetical protein
VRERVSGRCERAQATNANHWLSSSGREGRERDLTNSMPRFGIGSLLFSKHKQPKGCAVLQCRSTRVVRVMHERLSQSNAVSLNKRIIRGRSRCRLMIRVQNLVIQMGFKLQNGPARAEIDRVDQEEVK